MRARRLGDNDSQRRLRRPRESPIRSASARLLSRTRVVALAINSRAIVDPARKIGTEQTS